MSTNWTEEQREAIFTKNCNLLVAAGAGAGKTAVLVERIIQRIMDDKENVDIDNLLVVTFTNAAAAEMRERIGDAIANELELRPESKKLQRQLTLLNQANIMTIHSFCLQVIRSNFHIIDLDPSFRVVDNTEAILLKQESINEIFEQKYEDVNNKGFLDLIDSYGGKNDLKVQEMVLGLYEFAKSTPAPEKWLTTMAERFNIGESYDFGDSKWAELIMGYLKTELKSCKLKMEKAVRIIKSTDGIEHYLEPFIRELESINYILSCNYWDEFKAGFSDLEFDKLPTKKGKDIDVDAREKAKGLRDKVKKSLNSIKEDILSGSDNINVNLKELYPKMKSLIELVIQFDERYSDKKKERGAVDFSDIEHFCLDILTMEDEEGKIIPSETALEYKQQFEEILIDEYQDSNEVQEVIMNMIANKNDIPNMFMVGDVKQSIYRFRQAKPELFLSKYSRYSEEKGNKERKIKLFKNFRSRKEVIDGVNYLFKQIMSKEIGELEYDEGEALISGSEFPSITCHNGNSSVSKDCAQNICGGEIELHIIDKKDSEAFQDFDSEETNEKEVTSEEEEEADNIQTEARLVAKRINELIHSQDNDQFNVYDKTIKAYRPIKYKDIVILMRATAKWAPTFVEELTSAGIPVFADTATGYFETVEIKTVMSLLQIIDNPIQDIPLIAVLRSPIQSFSPEELIDIRMVNKEVSFYEAMKAICESDELISNIQKEKVLEVTEKYIDEDANSQIKPKVNKENEYKLEHISEELRTKLTSFLDKLNKWRRKVLHMPIDEFIWYLYTETGYYGFAGAMLGGAQRQANLRILFERAKQYEKTSYKGLFNFINFINKLRNSSGDMGSAKILGENEDVVRLMSIHKSKGLEFPVVILSGSGKNFNLMDINKSILFHGELGLGPDYVDPQRRISYPTIVKEVLRRKIKIETLSEEMRILYVALTRAKEKLIITGTVKDIEKTAEKWFEAASVDSNKISEHETGNAKSYMDWIGPAIIRHPCGSPLRDTIEGQLENYLVNDNSNWSIKTWSKEEFRKRNLEENEEEDIIKEIESVNLTEPFSEYNKEINRRLNWEYKYKEASGIPAKFSVSEIKRKFALVDVEDSSRVGVNSTTLKKPIFLRESRDLSPLEKGTLMHLVMQHLDLSKTNSYDEIKEQITSLIIREFITEHQSKFIFIDKILKFFQSHLGKRMKEAKKIYREVPFFIELPSTELYKELPEEIYKEEKVLIQGVIDCYFEEEDKLVLLDYKTDFTLDSSEIKDKYAIQVYYYKIALEKMTGKTVRNAYLYLFFKDEIVEM